MARCCSNAHPGLAGALDVFRLALHHTEAKETPRCWHHVQEAAASPGSMEFTVMSYNILAQDLMERHPQLYTRCKDFDLDWTNRSAALIQQILSHNADIVCLQEVQKDHWASQLKSAMTSHGYGTFFKQRKGGKSDGCAILYKKDKFGFLRFVPVDFVKGGILDRDNVGIILLLRPLKPFYNGSTDTICVATTHLLFNPKRGDIKLAQLMFLLAEIDRHAYKGMHLSSGFSKNHTSNDGMGQKFSKSNAKDIHNLHNQPNTSACNYFEDCVGHRGNQHKERKDGRECCEAIGDAENRTLTSDLSTSSTTIRVKDETKSVGHEEPPASSEGINHENASRQCFKAEEVSDEHSSYNPSYCPIILCGDFNSEPFSHLHQLITRGSLRYEGLISRCISGQKEGSEGGRDIYLSKELIPSSLKVSEGCQFLWATKSRSKDCKKTRVEREAENQHLQMNTGFLYHKMNFSSVYEHFIDTRHKNVSEVSTHHLKASCTVDYIFYSSNRSRLLQSKSVYHDKPAFDTRSSCSRGARAVSSGGFTIRISGSGGRSVVPSSSADHDVVPSSSADHDVGTSSAESHNACTSSSKCQTMDLSSSRGRHNMTSSKSAVMAPSSSPSVRPMMEQTSSNVDDNEEVEPLQLLARYRLMSTKEVARTGFLPNHVLPSDHLCLIARFLLR